jgi:hypothetical protein
MPQGPDARAYGAWATIVIAHQGGNDLVPARGAVAQFVADTAAVRHTDHERPRPVAAATCRSLAERLSPYVHRPQ